MPYRTHEAATLCNVTVNPVRNWCKVYGAFLCPAARGNRLFLHPIKATLKGAQEMALVVKLAAFSDARPSGRLTG